MDIVEQSPTQLVLNGGRVWLVAGSAVILGALGILIILFGFGLPTALAILIGLGLIGIAGGIMASVQIITWTFDKKRGTLETLHEGLISANRQQFTLRDIRTIEAEASPTQADKFRLMLRDKTGKITPLAPRYSLSKTKADTLVAAINKFLAH